MLAYCFEIFKDTVSVVFPRAKRLAEVARMISAVSIDCCPEAEVSSDGSVVPSAIVVSEPDVGVKVIFMSGLCGQSGRCVDWVNGVFYKRRLSDEVTRVREETTAEPPVRVGVMSAGIVGCSMEKRPAATSFRVVMASV